MCMNVLPYIRVSNKDTNDALTERMIGYSCQLEETLKQKKENIQATKEKTRKLLLAMLPE